MPTTQQLTSALRRIGFTGTMDAQVETRLGRRINPDLAEVGRLLWVDRPVLRFEFPDR